MVPLVAHTRAATAALALDRKAWASHPRFRTQALLLGSHENFRQTSAILISRAESGSDTTALRWVFQAWKGAMHSHERYEELKLYPYLHRRWGLSFDVAREGHRALSQAEEVVLARAGEDGPASAGLTDALRRHDEILREHLALEEELVLPALLALTPDEFDHYSRSRRP